ncbi:MAG: ECF transporter S component [Clostridia bacterium]|nr:ECF transporter S component [Clostridia bacterium]
MFMRKNHTLRIVMCALFAAMICVFTMLVQIPVPATGGYVNLGDGVILIGAFLLQPFYAAAAAGVGSMLADVLAGYVSYAPGTLVIKTCVALAASFIFRLMCRKKNGKVSLPGMIAAGVCAEIVMVLGYFVYEAVVLGIGAGASAGIPGNLGQGAVGILVACITAPLLLKNEELKNIMKK